MMTVIGDIIIGFAALINHTVNGMDNVVFPEINISLLTIIIAVAMAWDILKFYRRITDNPIDLSGVGEYFNNRKTGKYFTSKNQSAIYAKKWALKQQGQNIRSSYKGNKDYPTGRMK